MDFLSKFLKGIAIGAGAVAPGISGGALAVLFGLYENIMDVIANFFKGLKKNIIFLIPVGLGGVIGVIGLSRIINFLFDNFNIEIKYLFIGLMAGTLPQVFSTANKKGFKKSYIVFLLAAFLITILFTFLDNGNVETAVSSRNNIINMLICGAIIGFGTIIPGISASFILMYFGWYDIVINAIAVIDIMVLIPLGIGFVLSIVLFAKLINWLFDKAYGYTYYIILGFVTGSIIAIFPGFSFSLRYLLSLLLLILGFFATYYLSKFRED